MDLHRLNAYTKSQDLLSDVLAIVSDLPPGNAWLADQARRAAGSVALNVAEGWGRSGYRERRRAFSIAVGSAYEAVACVEIMHRMGVISRDRFGTLADGYDHVTRMLTRLR